MHSLSSRRGEILAYVSVLYTLEGVMEKLRTSLNMIICLYYWAQATETTDDQRIMCNVITIHLRAWGEPK